VPETGQCVFDPDRPTCAPAGCRVTAGGNTTLGSNLATGKKVTFGGQVGAPCGCSGCFGTLDGTDRNDLIQGNWTHNRHKGRLKASEFNSLECGCDGVFDGKLCNPGNRDPGPEPRPAPANMMCFTGVGTFDGVLSAFRVDLEDRGEPGAGKNAGTFPDVYRTRIWIPKTGESANALAQAACCGNRELTIRDPDIDDGDELVRGNMQIHPTLPNTNRGICPPPSNSCSD